MGEGIREPNATWLLAGGRTDRVSSRNYGRVMPKVDARRPVPNVGCVGQRDKGITAGSETHWSRPAGVIKLLLRR